MLARICHIAEEAGARILAHYADEVPVDYKADDSPLTQADRASHRLIVDRLRAAFPGLPVGTKA